MGIILNGYQLNEAQCTLLYMKTTIMIGIFIGGAMGGWIGALMTHGNWLSGWSIMLSTVGSFIGIWAGYKASQYIGG